MNRWPYLLRRPSRWSHPILAGSFSAVLHYGNRTFGTLTAAGELTIWPGYAWDGCTAAPDLPGTYHASARHDVLYQWLTPLEETGRLTRRQADRAFYYSMIQAGTPRLLAAAYYHAVRAFGRIARTRACRRDPSRDSLATILALPPDAPIPQPPTTIEP